MISCIPLSTPRRNTRITLVQLKDSTSDSVLLTLALERVLEHQVRCALQRYAHQASHNGTLINCYRRYTGPPALLNPSSSARKPISSAASQCCSFSRCSCRGRVFVTLSMSLYLRAQLHLRARILLYAHILLPARRNTAYRVQHATPSSNSPSVSSNSTLVYPRCIVALP